MPTSDNESANVVPYSREAEEAVIGSIFVNPEVYDEVAGILSAGSREFYIHRLRFIWEAFQALRERHIPIDFLTVGEELERKNLLEEIGGPAYLMLMLNQCPTSLHAEAYAQIVVDKRVRRDMLTAANKVAELAYDESVSVTDATTQAVGAITKAADGAVIGQTETAKEVFSRAYDRIDDLSRKPADFLPGVPTGFIDVDRILGGGLQKGRLYTLGGRPGNGKTSWLLSVAHHASFVSRMRGIFFSLEMSNDELADRLLSIDQKINGQIISTGKVDDETWPSLTQGIENGSNAPLLLDDTPGLTPLQMLAKCKRVQATMHLDYAIVDYLGLMSVGKFVENRVQEVSYISRMLKQISRELNIPVLAAHQLSREVEKRGGGRPQLSDLRDSGSVEQDSDSVIFVYANADQPNVTSCEVAKQRNGPLGIADLIFRKNFTKFENAARTSLRM